MATLSSDKLFQYVEFSNLASQGQECISYFNLNLDFNLILQTWELINFVSLFEDRGAHPKSEDHYKFQLFFSVF